MHLKCEEKKPCTRCVKKNIPCRSDGAAPSEAETQFPPDGAPLAVEENQVQVQDQQLSPENNGLTFETSMASNGFNDYSNSHLAPVSNGYPNGEALQQQAETAVLSDYLSNVLPNFSDPLSNLFSNGFGTGTFTPRGVSDFGFESNIELNDMDLSFLDSYNTDIPFYYGGSPTNVFPASTPGDSSNSSSEPYRSAAIGAEAYQKSYWKFKPKRQQSGFIEEHNLSLPADNGDQGSPESRISLPRRTIAEKLSTRTRDRILVSKLNVSVLICAVCFSKLLGFELNCYLGGALTGNSERLKE